MSGKKVSGVGEAAGVSVALVSGIWVSDTNQPGVMVSDGGGACIIEYLLDVSGSGMASLDGKAVPGVYVWVVSGMEGVVLDHIAGVPCCCSSSLTYQGTLHTCKGGY